MSESNLNSVDAGKWDWKAGGSRPPPKKPMNFRVKAVIQAIAMTAVAFVIRHFWPEHRIGPIVIWSLAGFVLVSGLFIPPAFHAFERFGVKLGFWVGTGLTYLFLIPFYYLVFTPAHMLLNARHIDPMAREFPTKMPSYWIPRKPVTVEQYKRQH